MVRQSRVFRSITRGGSSISNLLFRLTSAAIACAAASGLAACADGGLPGEATSPELAEAASQQLTARPGAGAGSEQGQKKGPGSPSVHPPLISPELDPSDLAHGPAPQSQSQPAAVFGGGQFFAAWSDSRDTGFDVSGIYGARIAANGEVIDGEGIAIAGFGFNPDIAFDGTNYFVVWEGDGVVLGARVSQSGEVLDPGGIVVGEYGSVASVAFDGTSFVVSWGSYWENPGLRVTRVSSEGVALDPGGVTLVPDSGHESDIAAGSDESLVAWNQDGDVYAARVAQGVVLDPGGFLVAAGASAMWRPAVVFDGANYLVAWEAAPESTGPQVAAARVSPEGVVLDPAGITLTDAPPYAYQRISAAFDGANTVVAWNTWNPDYDIDVVAARVSPAGAVLDPDGVLVTAHGGSMGVASGSAGLLALYSFEPDPQDWTDIYGTRLDGNLAPIGGGAKDRLISSTVARQREPAVAFDGQHYVTVWADERLPARGLYAARVTPWGESLDPAGIFLANGSGWDIRPTAIFDGTNTVVVWQTTDIEGGDGSLYAARLSPAGVALDASPIVLPAWGTSGTRYTAASDGASTLIVLDDGVVDWLGNKLRAIRLGPDGSILPPLASSAPGEEIAQVPLTDPGMLRMPTLHFDGTNYLLTWLTSEDGAVHALRGARLSPEGELLDPAGFSISIPAAGGNVTAPAAIAQLGANALVVWPEERNGTVSLRGAEISPAGAVLSPQSISIGGQLSRWDAHEWIRVGFDVADEGGRALVVWRDTTDAANPDLKGARVAPGGAVEPAFTVSAQPGPEGEQRVASNGLGRSLVAYHRPAENNLRQVKARFVTSPGCSYGPGGAGTGAGAAAPLALLALGGLARRKRRAAQAQG